MKLRTKFTVLLPVVTVGLSIVAYGGLESYRHRKVESARTSVSEMADIASDQIHHQLFSEMDRTGSYAGEMRLDDPETTRRALDALTSRRAFQHAAVVDRSGGVVMVAGPYNEAGRERILGSDVSSDECVGRTLGTGDLCVSPAERAAGSAFGEATHYVRFTAPAFDAAGRRVDGAVVVTYPLTERGAFVALRSLDTSILLLVDIAAGFAYWEYPVNLRQTGRLLQGFDALVPASTTADSAVAISTW